MKVRMEPESDHRGIIVTSENKDEWQLLQGLWTGASRVSVIEAVGGNLEITIAPKRDWGEE